MFRLTKSLGGVLLLTVLLAGGCKKKYAASGDAGTDAGGPENTAAACSDGIDNDGDGDTDCDDSDCSTMLICNVETICDDNIDNDNDGATDCDDHPDCDLATHCGGFCYNMDFQAPGVWGMAITEANDDLDPNTACVQYDVVVQATSPAPTTQVCLYIDDLSSASVGCADPTAQNPMSFRVDLCAGTHILYARVEQGANVCQVLNLGLEQIQIEVYEDPSCTITAPAGLSTDQANPTCVNQADLDIMVTTSGADAQLWIAGALTGTEAAVSGIVDFSGAALGGDADKTIKALCDNPGTGNGSTWSPDYYITKDTVGPTPQILSPATGTSFGSGECPFEVVVTGVEAGQQVCAHYTGQTPPPAACATSTSTSDQHTLTVQCIDGVDLTVEANTQDTCGNPGQATILVTADTGLPTVLIESPENGLVYNKASDTIDPSTDEFELVITACTDANYAASGISLLINGLDPGLTPTVQAAYCLGLSHRITWSAPHAFTQSPAGLQTQQDVQVTVSDGFNQTTSNASFHNDMIAPQVTFSCGLCRPNQDFFAPTDDTCAGPPFEAEARAQVSGLEVGQMINLQVTSSGIPVGASPYSVASTGTGQYVVTFNGPCGAELQNGRNQLQVTASDTAGNPAVPAVKVVTYGNGFVTSPADDQFLGSAEDCDGGAAYGIPVTVQIDHGSVANGTAIEVVVSSVNGGWSYPAPGADVWSKSCTGDPCTHTFCVPVAVAEVEQADIAAELLISSTPVPGGPSGIAVDLSPPGQAMNPARTVVNRRAAEIQLSWDSVEDAQSGLLQEWDVRCVANSTISAANWATAMQFAGEPTPTANGIAQTMNVAEDVNGTKIRAGSDYSCGIRGLNQVGLWSDVSVFPAINAADIDFVPYSLVIEGYTGHSEQNRFANIVGIGDINGDSYDDMIVGYGHSGGHAVAIYFGSATGPSETNKLEITCADPSFGAAIAGIGDFDGEPYSAGDTGLYPDFVISAPDEERVYVFRGHSGLGGAALDCLGADLKIVRPVGEELGGILSPIGDFDNDGLKDFAIGASPVDSWTGAVFVIFGRAILGGDINLFSGANADGALHFTPSNSDAAGSGITGADLNQDGFMDLVFGSHTGGVSNKGSVSVLLGYAAAKTPNTLTPLTDTDIDQVVSFVPSGWVLPNFGVPSVVSMDFNNDGCFDVVVGVTRHTVGGQDASGAVQVFYGEKVGISCTGAISTTVDVSINSQTARDLFGERVAPAYNFVANVSVPMRVNGVLTSPSDAVIVTGARQYDSIGGSSTGAGYVGLWYAGFASDLTSAQSDIDFAAPSGSIAWHIASFVGDLDGDGYTDLAIGDSDFASSGRIYLYR